MFVGYDELEIYKLLTSHMILVQLEFDLAINTFCSFGKGKGRRKGCYNICKPETHSPLNSKTISGGQLNLQPFGEVWTSKMCLTQTKPKLSASKTSRCASSWNMHVYKFCTCAGFSALIIPKCSNIFDDISKIHDVICSIKHPLVLNIWRSWCRDYRDWPERRKNGKLIYKKAQDWVNNVSQS